MEISKSLSDLKPTDIEQLVIENQQRESKTLEYKEIIPTNNAQKNKLLATISAFANTTGGVLIYGIKEHKKKSFDSGERYEIVGLTIEDLDQEMQKLENILRNNIEPQINGIQIDSITVSKKVLILIKVQQGWHPPYMVSLDGGQKFYGRNSVETFKLDVEGIRNSFLFSEEIGNTISNFRRDRLGKISAGETAMKMENTSALVLHILPLQSFSGTNKPSIPLSYDEFPGGYPKPMLTSGCNWKVNFDGFLSYSGISPECTYLQMFHNGCIEAVETFTLEEQKIPLYQMIYPLVEDVIKYLEVQKNLSIECPIFIALSLIHVKGHTVFTPNTLAHAFDRLSPIDRDNLILSEVMIDSYEQDIAKTLKPIFDSLSNAVGLSKSPWYQDDGVLPPRK